MIYFEEIARLWAILLNYYFKSYESLASQTMESLPWIYIPAKVNEKMKRKSGLNQSPVFANAQIVGKF